MRPENRRAIEQASRRAGCTPDPDAYERIEEYLSLVQARGIRLNLIAELDEDYLVKRHILDCLALLDILPGRSLKVIDVGSGSGFPGIVLSIMRPADEVHLLESRERKADFLREVVGRLRLRAEVIQARAEEIGLKESRECYDMAVARALGSPPVALELTLPLVAVGGLAVLMAGPKAAWVLGEIDVLGRPLGGRVGGWMAYELPDERGRIVIWLNKAEATEIRYPRSSARLRKEGKTWEERVGWTAGRKVDV